MAHSSFYEDFLILSQIHTYKKLTLILALHYIAVKWEEHYNAYTTYILENGNGNIPQDPDDKSEKPPVDGDETVGIATATATTASVDDWGMTRALRARVILWRDWLSSELDESFKIWNVENQRQK